MVAVLQNVRILSLTKKKFHNDPEAPGIMKIVLVDDFLNFIRVHNQGVAFGMGNGSSWAPIVFLIVPFVALIVISTNRWDHWKLN